MAPIHLKPCAALAPRVLLPGDPHRALFVAQEVLKEPLMFNHQRGLWGYTGEAPDGLPLTIQATGMGGPSAAIIVEELVDMGARTLIRIGTCGSLDPMLELGQPLVVERVLAEDGTSRALGAGDAVMPDPELTAALLAAQHEGQRPRGVAAVSTDLFYDERAGLASAWRDQAITAVEMEAATVLTLCKRKGVRGACLLAVSDLLSAATTGHATERIRIDGERLDQAGLLLGRLALQALSVAG
jgi:DeoD family purine-nucleoside phosphorylase